jgi:tetratricopeptide (TPR) repeat protein
VLALTDEIEKKYAGDEAKIGEARSLRVRALTALGKVKEAEDYLEGLLAADPDSKSTALAAGVLARTFDQQVSEMRAKDPKSTAADELWKQAFRYYVLSVKPKLGEGRATDELEKVGLRMLIMGEHFNGVPEGVTSFVGLKSGKKPVAPEYWEEAAKVFEAAAGSGSFNAKVGLARTLGYLGRFKEASDVYADIVENETLIDPSTNEINRSALTGRPELLGVYLELGVAKYELGKEDAEVHDESLNDASAIFARIVKVAPKQASESWWRARYYQLASWYEVGAYKNCLAAINDLERNSDGFDEARWKLGLKPRFEELKKEAERKVRK